LPGSPSFTSYLRFMALRISERCASAGSNVALNTQQTSKGVSNFMIIKD